MDPLSVTASILTIIGAVGVAVRAPSYIAAIRHAPDIMQTFQQETQHTYHEVQETGLLLQEAKSWNLSVPAALMQVLERLNDLVTELNDLVNECLDREEPRVIKQVRSHRLRRELKSLLEQISHERAALDRAKATLTL